MSAGRRAWAGCALCLLWACGDSDSSGPDPQTFTVRSASTTDTRVDGDGTIVTAVDLIVEDGVARIPGAHLVYDMSIGSLSTSVGVSDAEGLASVTWMVTPDQYAGKPTVTFSACADSQAPPACTPSVVLTISTGI